MCARYRAEVCETSRFPVRSFMDKSAWNMPCWNRHRSHLQLRRNFFQSESHTPLEQLTRQYVVNASTVNTFKNRLDRECMGQQQFTLNSSPDYYKYKYIFVWLVYNGGLWPFLPCRVFYICRFCAGWSQYWAVPDQTKTSEAKCDAVGQMGGSSLAAEGPN